MEKDARYISGGKELKLYVRRYTGEEKNGRVIIFLHGKMEYGDRHDAFCTLLADNRYVVYLHDHRKHGYSIGEHETVGSFDDDTWDDMLEDIHTVHTLAMEKETVSSVLMIGYSVVSTLLRGYLGSYGTHVEKAVLIGAYNVTKRLSRSDVS